MNSISQIKSANALRKDQVHEWLFDAARKVAFSSSNSGHDELRQCVKLVEEFKQQKPVGVAA